jgi:pilus assembly protein CpaB
MNKPRQTGGRMRAAWFLLISLAAAGLVGLVIYTVISNYQRELVDARIPEERVQVMVAAGELAQGQTIEADDLELKSLPPDYIPDSVLRQLDQAIGRVPRERILAGEFIREQRLADPEAGVGLNAIIPRGMRAVALNIDNSSSVSGFLNPGNYVDVLVTLPTGQEGELDTLTLLQAVTVLAVDDRMGSGMLPVSMPSMSGMNYGGQASGSVTLAITPEQAEKITHALTQGSVALTLRNDIDVTHVTTHGSQVEQRLGGEDGDRRLSISEWKERVVKQEDGTLIIIKGPKTVTQ